MAVSLQDFAKPFAFASEHLDIGRLPKGKLSRVALELVTDATGQPVRIPVLVARGATDGPTLGLTAAVHGDELNGILVIHNLFRDFLNVARLKGTVIGMPVANLPSFLLQMRRYPDGHDLNRIMPGRADGNRAEVYAYRLSDRLLPHLDYLLDLHTASVGRINSLYLRVNLNKAVNQAIAPLLNPQIIVHNAAKDGTFRDAAEDYGIPAITVEVGNPVRFQYKLINRTVDGVLRVLDHLGMLALEKEVAISDPPVYCKKSYWLYADEGGLLEVFPDLLEQVKAGETVAHLSNLYGDRLKEYTAPDDGIVVGRSVNPVGPAGARILHLGIPGEIQKATH